MNLKLMLENVTRQYGKKTAIALDDRRLSYSELDKASNKVANTLLKMGVKKGDRVAMLLANSPDFVIVYFGIVKIGAIAALLDVLYRLDELDAFLSDSQPKVLVAEGQAVETLIPFLPRFESIKQIISLGSGYGGQFLSYEEIMAQGSAQRSRIEPEPDDVAHIAYSSGPSFTPRGVMLTHGSLVRESAIAGDGFQQTDNDIMMLYALPMHHMFGLVAGMLSSLYRGSTVVIVPGTGLSLGSFMATVEREKGTMFLGVPYIYALAIDMAEKEGIKSDLSSLRLCISAGAPLPIDIIKRFKERYGFDILDCWGLTEATCHLTCPPLDGSSKLGSVGKPLPGWAVKIVDDDGRELPVNHAGEIIVSGPIMKGYYNNPKATSETLKNGWLYTGDLGKLDEDGYLFITGRKKKTIIIKGQNVYAGDIESVLARYSKVAKVRVVSIPDRLRGEVVGVFLGLKDGEMATEQEIKEFCLEHLASYKVPRHIVFSGSQPKNPFSALP